MTSVLECVNRAVRFVGLQSTQGSARGSVVMGLQASHGTVINSARTCSAQTHATPIKHRAPFTIERSGIVVTTYELITKRSDELSRHSGIMP